MTLSWEHKTIGDVCEVVNGATPKTGTAAFWDGQHQWVTPAEMGKRTSPYLNKTARSLTTEGLDSCSASPVPPHSIIMSSRAPIGHLVINTVPMSFNQGCKGLIPRAGLDHKFLYYYLFSKVDHLNDLGTGATFKELSAGNLKKVAIPVPPLPEQQRIVGILDQAFEGIAKAKLNAERNLENAKALFESERESLFAEDAEAEERSFDEICDITSTLVDPREAIYQPMLHIGAGNIESDTGILSNLQSAAEEKLISGKFTFDDSMVLYSKIRPYLKKVVAPDFGGLCSADIYPLTPTAGVMQRDYLYHMLLTKRFTDYAIAGSDRAGMPKVNRAHLFAYKVGVPSIARQMEVIDRLQDVRGASESLSFNYKTRIRAIDELKSSILHQAFSGKL